MQRHAPVWHNSGEHPFCRVLSRGPMPARVQEKGTDDYYRAALRRGESVIKEYVEERAKRGVNREEAEKRAFALSSNTEGVNSAFIHLVSYYEGKKLGRKEAVLKAVETASRVIGLARARDAAKKTYSDVYP